MNKLILLALLTTSPTASARDNDCYGSGCLPTRELSRIISQPSPQLRYDRERNYQQQELRELRESNAISREQLRLQERDYHDTQIERELWR